MTAIGNFSDSRFAADSRIPDPFSQLGDGVPRLRQRRLAGRFLANGHVYPGVDQHDWGTTWAERPLLFRNLDGNKFAEVPAATGSGLALVLTARGAAFGDLFNDGHIDVVLNNVDPSRRYCATWSTIRITG